MSPMTCTVQRCPNSHTNRSSMISNLFGDRSWRLVDLPFNNNGPWTCSHLWKIHGQVQVQRTILTILPARTARNSLKSGFKTIFPLHLCKAHVPGCHDLSKGGLKGNCNSNHAKGHKLQKYAKVTKEYPSQLWFHYISIKHEKLFICECKHVTVAWGLPNLTTSKYSKCIKLQ